MRQITMILMGGLCLSLSLAFAQPKQPVKVEITRNDADSSFQLLRGGKPYFIKGAGGGSYLSRIPVAGGNSIRTWGTHNAQKLLDSAYKHGLTVLLGLGVTGERHGFNYDDAAAVRQQLEELKGEVKKYKDHPALLAWGIGNELNLFYTNQKVWNAVQDISKMIHSLDKNHPVGTVLAGINKKEIDYINEHCTDIDFLGINIYGGLATLPKRVQEVGWKGPYMVTEWGPTGHWESLSTAWNQPVEETSSEKAAVYKSRYEYSVERDKKQCLGSYVFLWGQKQERTPTWYGLFTEKGEESEVVDVMQYLWSGKWPANKAPHIYSLQLDGKKAAQSVYVEAGKNYEIKTAAFDPDNDILKYRWELLPEPTKVGEGGDHEDRPQAITGAITDKGKGNATLKSPATKGAYRLFVYITDGHNNVATANLPFYVNETAKAGGYTLKWSDEFDGDALSLAEWTYDNGDGCPNLCGWGNNELQYYTGNGENLSFKDGNMIITAKKEARGNKQYTSARIKTQGKKKFKYGRVDVRAMMPAGKGIWPAFWFMPEKNVHGGWPKSGELDMMEYLGHEANKVYGTVHFGPGPGSTQISRSTTSNKGLNEAFHVYSLIWEEDKIQWLLDDVVFSTITKADVGVNTYPFNEDFYMIVNLAVGGNWPGNPDASTKFPQDLIVDYIRVFQKS